MKLYLAGKIGADDWRHSIVLGLRTALRGVEYQDCGHGELLMALPNEWPILRGAVLGQHDYVGPFFMPGSPADDSHIIVHGDNLHGSAITGDQFGVLTGAVAPEQYRFAVDNHRAGSEFETLEARKLVVRLCLQAITKADAVFVWMDSCTAYGTLVEIGFAIAQRKPIWWGEPIRPYDKIGEDFWFARSTAEMTERSDTAKSALEAMLARKFRTTINGHVYVLRSGDFIKIGKSKFVDQRVTQISPKTPMPVTLLHSIACEDMSQVEAALHRRYAHYRTNGEWFLLPQEELDWLLTIKTVNRLTLPGVA